MPTAPSLRSVRSMASAKLKLGSVLVLMLGLVAGGFGALVHPQLIAAPQTGQQADPIPTAKGRPQPKNSKKMTLPRADRYGDPLPQGVLARLGTIRLRRGYEVYSLSKRDSFLTVYREAESTALCRWHMSTGELLNRVEFPLRTFAATVSSDGKLLAVSGRDERSGSNHIYIYDLSSGKRTVELVQAGGPFALAFATDGKMLAGEGDDKIVRLWDPKTGTELRRCQATNNGFLHRLAFSPDGKLLASAGLQERTVHLWDTATGKEQRVFNEGPGRRCTIVFAPDGQTIATASQDDTTVRLWETASGKEKRQFSSELGIASLAFSPDGRILAAGCAPKPMTIQNTSPIYLWDASTGTEVHRLPRQAFTVTSLAFSADGKRLVSGSSSAVARVWDTATGKELVPFDEHESWITSVTYSPDGRFLATGSLDGTIRLWEAATGQPIRVFEGGVQPQVLHVAFSPDGRKLISDSPDGSLRVWDVAAGRQIRGFKVGEGRRSHRFASSPDGRTVAVWHEDGTIRLLDAETGAERRKLPAGGNGDHLCFSPDGRTLASLRRERRRGGVLQLWDSGDGKRKQQSTTAVVGPIVFSPDGRFLMGAAGDDYLPAEATQRSFHCWDVATGTDRPFVVPLHARIFSLVVSPDGRMLAWGDTAGTVTLWDRAANQVRRRLNGHHTWVNSVAFSPDGKTLASGSADTTVLLWDVTGWPPDAPAESLSAERLAMLWTDLASNDAAKAFDAIGLLTASPEQTVPLLKSKLHPAPEPGEPKQMARLIAQLNSDEFAVREKAQEQLRQFGERAEPSLREALKDKLTLEMRKRIEEILEGVRTAAAAPENLRSLRAVEALEHIDTAEAREVLKILANGASSARLTREAKASLERLSRRHNPKP